MQLRPAARRPAGLAVKPLKPIIAHAAMATVPNRASSYGLIRPLLLPRITSHSSSSAPQPPAPGSVRGTGRRSCQAPRTKARDDEAEREPGRQQAPPAKQAGEEQEAGAAERNKPAAPPPAGGERSMAYQIFAGLYVCAYVFFWRTGELIVVNAQEALERLRRYVRDNFFDKKR